MKYLILLIATLSLALEIGEIKPINLNNFKEGKIILYKDLKNNLSQEILFTDKNTFQIFYNHLFETMDSYNAPEAFQVLTNNYNIKCLRTIQIQKEQSECAISATMGDSIEHRKDVFSIECLEY